ncbi:hypothetical protein [Microcystis aeruginosa]|uniref:hypothetical protein n=1 Tax=Microcystis aeruginosa TaxID=1126 RepID=UPI00130507D4|nr:hypothetical protein [Microcystis aeruginosa]
MGVSSINCYIFRRASDKRVWGVGCGVWGVGCGVWGVGMMNYEVGRWGSGEIELKP